MYKDTHTHRAFVFMSCEWVTNCSHPDKPVSCLKGWAQWWPQAGARGTISTPVLPQWRLVDLAGACSAQMTIK